MYSEAAVYPFCAVVGQERAKKALLLHAANPLLKGVLLAGESGTSKTTLIRGLAALLQERRRINIPLHVDNERLFGGVDTAAALRYGIRKILPGLLAGADGQIVMVDDLNLMSERTLHAILAVVEQGGYEYERKDGEEACWQSSSFMLLGTMNPEEAGLKPGLLDRLGLYVRVETSLDPVERAEITRRRLAFERNPNDFARSFEPASAALQEQLVQTRRRLSSVSIAKPMLRLAAEVAAEAGCAGQRADILLAELARTLAAWEGRLEVDSAHLQEAAEFILPHRMRAADRTAEETADREQPGRPEQPSELAGQEPAQTSPQEQEKYSGHGQDSGQPLDGTSLAAGGEEEASLAPQRLSGSNTDTSASEEDSATGTAARVVVETIGRNFDVRRIAFTPPRTGFQGKAGKRNPAQEGGRTGRYVHAEIPRGSISDLALDATLRAAAPYQHVRRRQVMASDRGEASPRVLIERSDLRVKVRESRTGTALLFVVDASGSMNAAKRMKAVKGAVLSLLHDAYRQRDSVGLVAFRDSGAELLLDITRSVELAERRLRSMPVGGRTPLLAGLEKGMETIRTMLRKGSGLIPAMIVITDGKANAGMAPGLDLWPEIRRIGHRISAGGIQTLVIDTEQGFVRLGYASKLADCLQAQYFRLDELDAGRIERAVRNLVQEQNRAVPGLF